MSTESTPKGEPKPATLTKQSSALDNFLTNLVPLWPALHSLSESKLVKSSYVWLVVVPLMAKVIHAMNYKITLFANEIPLSLPFSPRIFYFAAVAFALANITYYLFCPAAVKGYRTYKEFSDAGKGADVVMAGFIKLLTSRSLMWPLPFNENAGRTFLKEYSDFSGTWESIDQKKPETIDALYATPISATKLPGAFGFVQWNYFRALPLARLVCSVSYLAGFLLVLRLSYENLRYVLESVR
jgi:hypothetical protein